MGLDARYEAIATPPNCFEYLALISHSATQREDVLTEIRFLNKRVGPNSFQQLIPFHQFTGMHDEHNEYLEGFWRE
jgi:hypothetical protein